MVRTIVAITAASMVGIACSPSGNSINTSPPEQQHFVAEEATRALSDSKMTLLCEAHITDILKKRPFPFDTSDKSAMYGMLADFELTRCWNNVLYILPFIASADEVLAAVKAQMKMDFNQTVLSDGGSGRSLAELHIVGMQAVGNAFRRDSDSEDIAQFLQRAANPGYWLAQDRGVVAQAEVLQHKMSPSSVAMRMAHLAVQGMATARADVAKRELAAVLVNSQVPQSIREHAERSLKRVNSGFTPQNTAGH